MENNFKNECSVYGKVLAVVNENGFSKENKPWANQYVTIETEEQYPKTVVVKVQGEENVNKYKFQELFGKLVFVRANTETKTYTRKDGKEGFDTTLRVWYVVDVERYNAQQQTQQQTQAQPIKSAVIPEGEGLPF